MRRVAALCVLCLLVGCHVLAGYDGFTFEEGTDPGDVLVTLDEASGLTIEEAWGAVWVAGTHTVSPATTALATATLDTGTSGIAANLPTSAGRLDVLDFTKRTTSWRNTL